MRVIASCGAMREGSSCQLSRPAIVGGGQIALLESDFGGQGLNRGQLTMLREEVVRDLGRLIQFAQLQKRASEAGAGAGRRDSWRDGAANRRGHASASPAASARAARSSRSVADSPASCSIRIQQLRGVIELTADTEPCRELESKFGRQRTGFGEVDLRFVNGHRGDGLGARGHLAGQLHA